MASARRSGSRSLSHRSSAGPSPAGGVAMKRNMVLGATLVVALGAGGAALGHKAAAGGVAAKQGDGGLSLSPVVIEHNTAPGALPTLTVANRSGVPMNVTVTARPWLQST